MDQERDNDARHFADVFNADLKTDAPVESAATVEAKSAKAAEDAVDQQARDEAFDDNPVAPKPAAPKAETFAQAWARNRKENPGKTFTWEGKPGVQFSTENKAEKAKRLATKAAPAPKATATPEAKVINEPAPKAVTGVREAGTPASRGSAATPGPVIKPTAMLPAVAPSAKPGQKYNINSGAPVDAADDSSEGPGFFALANERMKSIATASARK